MAFANTVKFTAGNNGTADFNDGLAATGFRNLASAGVINGAIYSYRAVSVDGSQWENGQGAYTAASPDGSLARSTIFESSNAGGKVNFTVAPVVFLTPLKADLDPGKESIWVPATAMRARITNGPSLGVIEMTSNKNVVATLDFDTTTQEFAQFDIRMPKSWNEGTVTFIPVWSHAATATNFGVVWGLDAVAISDDDTLDVAFGTEQTSTDTGGTTNDSYQGPESAAITIAGSPATGDLVQFRVHRDPANGSDTMAIDARLHGVLVLYTVDTMKDD